MDNLTKDQEYDVARGVLKSIASLRALLRSYTLDQVDEIIKKVESIRDEKFYEYEELEGIALEKEEARLKVVESLESANIEIPKQLSVPITVDMLINGDLKIKKPKKIARAKYAVKLDNGEWLTWSGRGRRALWLDDDKYKNIDAKELEESAEIYNEENDL